VEQTERDEGRSCHFPFSDLPARGIPMAATINTMMPMILGCASRYPRRDNPEPAGGQRRRSNSGAEAAAATDI
jgi:hypothetical protein